MSNAAEQLTLLASSNGFDAFGVFDIDHRVERQLFPKLGLNNLDYGFARDIHEFGDLNANGIFRKLSDTAVPFRWTTGVDCVSGTRIGRSIVDEQFDELLNRHKIVGGYCVSVQAPQARRNAVVYFSDQTAPEDRYPDLVFDTMEVFERDLQVSNKIVSEEYGKLSASERNCLVWCACGKTSSEIGTILSLSEHTVNHYFTIAASKLGTKNRVHTVAKAIQLGLIDRSELS